ncbi:hypothetical protein BU23DRAFT_570536 [Bimuria novae-zelandiae CBS 107.79]|uniref:Uncharacterized protein n=1 Tax=Bimuria novae-zelandiae CBS 107.79 TaxID=1447943 RepID=A0A6A5UZM0_9PLEO|nr:hypothetical protein BU23DRAFT_570536 [Bimuria novae-zelandiae CBS 107.79]
MDRWKETLFMPLLLFLLHCKPKYSTPASIFLPTTCSIVWDHRLLRRISTPPFQRYERLVMAAPGRSGYSGLPNSGGGYDSYQAATSDWHWYGGSTFDANPTGFQWLPSPKRERKISSEFERSSVGRKTALLPFSKGFVQGMSAHRPQFEHASYEAFVIRVLCAFEVFPPSIQAEVDMQQTLLAFYNYTADEKKQVELQWQALADGTYRRHVDKGAQKPDHYHNNVVNATRAYKEAQKFDYYHNNAVNATRSQLGSCGQVQHQKEALEEQHARHPVMQRKR